MNNQSQYSSQNSSTYGYLEQKVNNLNKTDFILKRAIFQTIEKQTKIFLIQESLPYDIKTKIKQKASLNQEILLGEGGYGSVYLALHQILREYFALKISFNLNEEQLDKTTNEYIIQSLFYEAFPEKFLQIKHVYIQQKEYNNYTVIAGLELALTSLQDYQNLTILKEEEIINIYYQILEQILIMHKHQYAHRDIKPQNILYCEKKGWVLSDFGCSMKYKQVTGFYQIKGTKAYLHQSQRKLLQGNQFEQIAIQMDLFQNDILAFQMTILQLLFRNKTIQEIQKVLDNQVDIHSLIDQLYNKQYQEIYFITTSNKKQSNNFIQDIQLPIRIKLENYLKLQDENKKIKQKLIEIEILEKFQDSQEGAYQIFNKNFLEFCQTCSEENQFYLNLKMLNKMQIITKLDKIQRTIQKPIRKWQYKILQDYLYIIGDLEIYEQNCKQFLKFSGSKTPSIYLDLLKCYIWLGKINDAKQLIEEIQLKAEIFDELSLLQYFCLRAKIQGDWLQISDRFIEKMKHFQQFDFYDELYVELFYGYGQGEPFNIAQSNQYEQKILKIFDYSEPQVYHFLCKANEVSNNFEVKKLTQSLLASEYSNINPNNISAKQIISLLQQKGFEIIGILSQLNKLGIFYQFNQNYQQALNIYQEQINFIEQFYPTYVKKNIIFMNYAQFLFQIDQYELAIYYANSAIQLISKYEYIELIKCNLLIWTILIYQGNFEQSVQIFEYIKYLMIQCPECKTKQGIFKRAKFGFIQLLEEAQNCNLEFYQKHLYLLEQMIKIISNQSNEQKFKEKSIAEQNIEVDYQSQIHFYQMFLFKRKDHYFNILKDSINLLNCFNDIFLEILKMRKDSRFTKLALKSMLNISSLSQQNNTLNQNQKMIQSEKFMQATIVAQDLNLLSNDDQIQYFNPLSSSYYNLYYSSILQSDQFIVQSSKIEKKIKENYEFY